MIFSSIKVYIRNILKNKVSFLIKTIGLTIGFACFILIYLYVNYEFSYDKLNNDHENIYRIVQQQKGNNYMGTDVMNVVPGPLPPYLKEQFPEFVYTTRVKNSQRLVQYNNMAAIENRFLYVDPDFVEIFNIQGSSVNLGELLGNPNSILLTKSMANKYFGKENPIRKTLMIDENRVFQVTGVIDNAPGNTHLQYDFLASNIDIETDNSWSRDWRSSSYQCYVKVQDNISVESLSNKFNLAVDKKRNMRFDCTFILQPISYIHLNGKCNFELSKNGNISQVYTFLIIGILLSLTV